MSGEKVLIHSCCAPCLCYPHKALEKEGFEVVAYWYNPNIHPFSEFQLRLNTLYKYQVETGIKIIYNENYDIFEWMEYTYPGWKNRDKEKRCTLCYEMRLINAAEKAKELGIKYFTSTLLYSKFQYHDNIKKLGEKIAREKGVEFLYRDFREGWKEGIKLSKEYNLYRQRYCGCIFSETYL